MTRAQRRPGTIAAQPGYEPQQKLAEQGANTRRDAHDGVVCSDAEVDPPVVQPQVLAHAATASIVGLFRLAFRLLVLHGGVGQLEGQGWQ